MVQTISWDALPGAPMPGTLLCDADAVPDNAVLMLDLPAAEKPFRLLLLSHHGVVRAFVNRCAHFGVPLAQIPAHLKFNPGVNLRCNVHYASYHWADGRCESGECAGEDLISVPVFQRDGKIFIGLAESVADN